MQNLINLRKNRGLKQSQVADYLGITSQAYGHYERDGRNPDNETLKKLADFFDVSVDYLLGRDEKKEPSTEAEGIIQRLTKIIDDKYSKDELKSMTDDDLNLISDIFIDTIKNVKKYNK